MISLFVLYHIFKYIYILLYIIHIIAYSGMYHSAVAYNNDLLRMALQSTRKMRTKKADGDGTLPRH